MNPCNRIVLVCRNEEKAAVAKKQVVNCMRHFDLDFDGQNIISIACDHASLENVRRFNEVLRDRLNETFSSNKWMNNGIDVLCLNAAVLVSSDAGPSFTKDGLEHTFQVNYLTPFLICNLVMDLMNPGSRIIFSTSGLHRRFADVDLSGLVDSVTGSVRKGFEMIDNSSFDYKVSYAHSKLCLVMLCSELAKRLQSRGIIVNCFSPGLMYGSGLFRHQLECYPSKNTCLNKDAISKEKPVGWGAGALVYMATANETGKRSAEYWSDPDSILGWDSVYGTNFIPEPVSQNLNQKSALSLWDLSMDLAGLPKF